MSMKITVKITGKGIDTEIKEGIYQAVDRAAEEAAEQILDISAANFNIYVHPPIDTNQLRDSRKIISKFWHKEVIYNCPYALYVEYGTKPHMPPFEPIRDWVYRKRKEFELPKNIKRQDKRIEAIANKIRWKIWHKGTTGKPFLRPAFHIVKHRVPNLIKKYVKRYLTTIRV